MAQNNRILILGGGFAGIYCAKKLEDFLTKGKIDVKITLVNKQNFFVFTPMLPQIVSGMIESNHVVVPIRQILKHTRFYEADVTYIDVISKRVKLNIDGDKCASSDLTLEYDHLVIALGSDTSFQNMPKIEGKVYILKNLRDALVLRNHIIDMLERADIETDHDSRRQMLNFVIVGGGLSGIETAAELNTFLNKVLKYYPNLKSKYPVASVHVSIIQSRERILPEMNSQLAEFTLKKLRNNGISVLLNSRVVDVSNGLAAVQSKDGKELVIPTNTIIWTAGVSPNPIIASIPGEKPASGRLTVDTFLRVKGCENIWAIGDSAYITNEINGEPVPATAQYALREAKVAAENIASLFKSKSCSFRKFDYARNAQMAIIGERTAIANIAGLNLSGFLIWCLWRIVYLKKLPMLKKRFRVLFDWMIDMFFDPDLTHLRGLKEIRMTEKGINTKSQ